MRKFLSAVLCIALAAALTGCGPGSTGPGNERFPAVKSAENAENKAPAWDYPIRSWDAARESGLDFMGWKDSCNPPEDVLHALSARELARLTLSYPLLPYMPSGATDCEAEIFIGVFEGYSTIFAELRQRDDRNACILAEYAANVPDIDAWNAGKTENTANWAEHFTEQYLFVYAKELTPAERDFYLKTVEEKREKYYSGLSGEIPAPGLCFDENGAAYRKGYEGK